MGGVMRLAALQGVGSAPNLLVHNLDEFLGHLGRSYTARQVQV